MLTTLITMLILALRLGLSVEGEIWEPRVVEQPAPVVVEEVIAEDDPRWDCETMGNKICGPDPKATTILVACAREDLARISLPGFVSTDQVDVYVDELQIHGGSILHSYTQMTVPVEPNVEHLAYVHAEYPDTYIDIDVTFTCDASNAEWTPPVEEPEPYAPGDDHSSGLTCETIILEDGSEQTICIVDPIP